MKSSLMMCVGEAMLFVAGVIGCGRQEENVERSTVGLEASDDAHVHGAWWCNEHGVPEEVCALCSTQVAAEFKAKNDWCEPHDRPESQCFICHPEKEAEFAALYEAKYGKKPPTVNSGVE
jgi:cobalt-zinc-cadmium efflux system membrane fusion protein